MTALHTNIQVCFPSFGVDVGVGVGVGEYSNASIAQDPEPLKLDASHPHYSLHLRFEQSWRRITSMACQPPLATTGQPPGEFHACVAYRIWVGAFIADAGSGVRLSIQYCRGTTAPTLTPLDVLRQSGGLCQESPMMRRVASIGVSPAFDAWS